MATSTLPRSILIDPKRMELLFCSYLFMYCHSTRSEPRRELLRCCQGGGHGTGWRRTCRAAAVAVGATDTNEPAVGVFVPAALDSPHTAPLPQPRNRHQQVSHQQPARPAADEAAHREESVHTSTARFLPVTGFFLSARTHARSNHAAPEPGPAQEGVQEGHRRR